MNIHPIDLAQLPAQCLSEPALSPRDPGALARTIAEAVAIAAVSADTVDRDARFPEEAVAALRAGGWLGALIPAPLGGLGLPLSRIAAACCTLGQACSATAMIFAMHQIQVACLVQHASAGAWHQNLLRRIAADGLLVASVTSEVGVGGQMRISRCAIEPVAGGVLRVTKHASALSYGAHADMFLLTARRACTAAEHDQVLVALHRADVTLERTGAWDTLGMRGTCTEAFTVRAQAAVEQILPEPFSVIASETMVPVSHLLWSSLWLGIAIDAVHRARGALRAGRRTLSQNNSDAACGLPAGATRLAEAVEHLQLLQARVREAIAGFEAAQRAPTQTQSLPQAAHIASLKTSVSEGCLAVVQQALLACGFAGYQNNGRYSLSRHLRDLQSAPLMINNDRIRMDTARLLLGQKPSLGLQ
jgi:acyl-CoA dehydrogenase